MLRQDDFGADGGVLTLTMPPQGYGVPATIVVCRAGSGHPGRPALARAEFVLDDHGVAGGAVASPIH